ncbi:MAG: hypothetical protein KKB50_17560 [Planctomycetes bacterium]|nr:hypothetical protein [Planctomycetota bacterium]
MRHHNSDVKAMRRKCPNTRCDQRNRLDARYCARCGLRLSADAETVPAQSRVAPHWFFVVVFVGFFVFLFVSMLRVAGATALFFCVPLVIFGVAGGRGRKEPDRARLSGRAAGPERH